MVANRPKISAEVFLTCAVLAVHLLCWILTWYWGNYVNQYVWVEGHASSPGSPAWLPVSDDVFAILNIYLAWVCALAGLGVGIGLLRYRLMTGVLVMSLSCLCGFLLAIWSIVGTF